MCMHLLSMIYNFLKESINALSTKINLISIAGGQITVSYQTEGEPELLFCV